METIPISTIQIHARYADDGHVTHVKGTWDGNSRYTAATLELLERADPRWVDCPPLDALALGDVVRVGQFRLKVVFIDLPAARVIFERLDDAVIAVDADGWIEG